MSEKTKNMPFCVISKAVYGDYDMHDIQTNTMWTENPYGEEYAVVPSDMVEGILKTKGFCDVVLSEDGTEVVSFIAREIPNIEKEHTATTEEDLMAMAIDHEYRLTLLELGVE